jgi:magnesium transporter
VLRVIRLEGEVLQVGGRELAAPGATIWVDCTPDPDNLDWLATRFGFHPLALEDAAHADQRSKFEDYPGTAFVVLHRLSAQPEGDGPGDLELHAFLTPEALVTVRANPIAELDQVFDRARVDPGVLSRGADFALYLVYDAITDAHFQIADQLLDEVEVLNEEVVENPREREVQHRVGTLRHRIAHMRRRLAPQREVLAALARPGQPVVHERTIVYFRDVQDHIVRITEELDVARDLLAQTMEIYLSSLNNKLSTVMARMALVSTIFLPLTFITSFFGMNLPGTDRMVGWWAVAAVTVVLPPAMFVLFRRRGWF